MASKNKTEEEIRKLSVELRLLEQTAEAIQARINMVNAAITDLTLASMTLEGIGREKEDSELFVPIGGNSYIKAKLENPDKVIVGMGAGISVEKKLQETKVIIKERLDGLDKNRMTFQQQFAQVAEKINEKRGELNKILADLRKGKTLKNV